MRLGNLCLRDLRRASGVTLALLAAHAFAAPAAAAELLRVGKSVPEAFSFVPLDIGMRVGLFRKYGLTIEASALSGGARLQQALAADSIDIGLGSGPEMSAIAKVMTLAIRPASSVHWKWRMIVASTSHTATAVPALIQRLNRCASTE